MEKCVMPRPSSIPVCTVLTLLMLGLGLASCNWGEGVLVLTREAEVSDEFSGWESGSFHTGIALTETEEEPAVGNYVYLRMNIPIPGTYYPWILGGLTTYRPGQQRQLKITITPFRANSQSPMDSVELRIGPDRALRWVSAEGPERGLEFPDLGEYFLIVEGVKDSTEARIVFDKLLLTNAPGYVPTGYARYPDTVQAALPPAWAFGVIYGGNTDQAATLARIDSLRQADLPVDAYWIDARFWDYGGRAAGPAGPIHFRGDERAFPDPQGLFAAMDTRHVQSGLWVWDTLFEAGHAEVFQAFVENDGFTGPPEAYPLDGGNPFDSTRMGTVDFEMASGRDLWLEYMRPLFEGGLDFLKLEGGHDPYYLQTAFAATQTLGQADSSRGFILGPLAATHLPTMPRYPTLMADDAVAAWSQPDFPTPRGGGGLREQLAMIADPRMATYQVPFFTHDAGGHRLPDGTTFEPERFMRWAPMALMTPISTFFHSKRAGEPVPPLGYGPKALEVFRYYAQLKLRLFPYLYACAHQARRMGVKPIHGWADHSDQYLLGEDILVAPVIREGARERSIYLPEGEWLDFYSGEAFAGGAELVYPAPLDRLPLLVRAGGILPMRAYAPAVTLGDNDRLFVHVYPGSAREGSFTLIEDDGMSLDYREGAVAETRLAFRQGENRIRLTVGERRGSFSGAPQERITAWILHGVDRPVGVELDGEPLPPNQWPYEEAESRLRVEAGQHPADQAYQLDIRWE